jgi:hypothetical protein
MHHARSFFHELIGFTLIGILMFVVSFIDIKLAFVLGIPAMIHITEDIIMGKSMPLMPFDKTEIQIIPRNMQVKIAVDIAIIIIFSLLWIQYLNAA